jgi:hypothetical protein
MTYWRFDPEDDIAPGIKTSLMSSEHGNERDVAPANDHHHAMTHPADVSVTRNRRDGSPVASPSSTAGTERYTK